MSEWQKLCAHYYAPLAVGVGVYTDDVSPVYVNPAFLELCRLGAHEFGSAEAARAELEKSFVQYRNRKTGTIRFLDAKGTSLLMHLAVSSIKIKGRGFRLYTLWGPPKAVERYVDPARSLFIYGGLRLNTESRTAFSKRKLLPLTAREFELLAYLCAHEDRLLTKAELLREVWGKRALGTRTLDVYISRIKAKLVASGIKGDLIRTQHGQGYVFTPAG